MKRKTARSMHRRYQAALEYLTTYGWAILVFLLVIGILMFSGIFRSSSSVTNAPIITGLDATPVTAAAANSTDFYISLSNNVGSTMKITNVTVTVSGRVFDKYICSSTGLFPGENTTCEVNGSFSGTVNAVVNVTYSVSSASNLTTTAQSTGSIRLQTGTTRIPSISFTTLFAESGLPSGYNWSMTYNGQKHWSTTNSISITSKNGTFGFSVYNLSNSTGDFIDRFAPVNASGNLPAGNSKLITFSRDHTVIYVYVGDFNNGVLVINASSNAIVKNISTGTGTRYLTLSTNGSFVYAQNTVANTTSVINTVSNTVVKTINDFNSGYSENSSTGITTLRNSTLQYRSDVVFIAGKPGISNVGVINASNSKLVGEKGSGQSSTGGIIIQNCVTVNNPPTNLSCNGYVQSSVDLIALYVSARVPNTSNGYAIALQKFGSNASKIAYLTEPSAGVVGVLNLSNEGPISCFAGICYTQNKILTNVTSSSGSQTGPFHTPEAVAFSPNKALAYVTNYGGVVIGTYISVINTTTNRVIQNISGMYVGSLGGTSDISVTPDGKYAYIAYDRGVGPTQKGAISVINLVTNQNVKNITGTGVWFAANQFVAASANSEST